MLEAQNINFIVFDQQSRILYPINGNFPSVELTPEEWNVIERGETLVVYRDVERFERSMTFVALPYVEGSTLAGGVLLASPVSGIREMVTELNRREMGRIGASLWGCWWSHTRSTEIRHGGRMR